MAARAKKTPPFQVPQPAAKIEALAGTPAHDFLVAASLAGRIISKSRVATWEQVSGDPSKVSTDLRITPEQAQIIVDHEHVVKHIHIKQKGATDGETQLPAICPECNQWFLITNEGSMPTKCALTRGCTGVPVKVTLSSAAKAEPHTTSS